MEKIEAQWNMLVCQTFTSIVVLLIIRRKKNSNLIQAKPNKPKHNNLLITRTKSKNSNKKKIKKKINLLNKMIKRVYKIKLVKHLIILKTKCKENSSLKKS